MENPYETELPISIQNYVTRVIGEKDSYDGADYVRAGVAMFGGCARCEASIAAYNAYPSKSGVWMCADCIGDGGFETVEEFVEDTWGEFLSPL